MAQNITVHKLELELEADINITSVWGTGDVSPKPVGFEAVRVNVHFDADAPKETLDALVAHATLWSAWRTLTPNLSRSPSSGSIDRMAIVLHADQTAKTGVFARVRAIVARELRPARARH